MKKLAVITLVSLLSVSSLMADGMKCGAGKCGSSTKSTKGVSKTLFDRMQKDGFMITLSSEKPLVVGDNTIFVTLQKSEKKVSDAKVKIKFFMPEMPGMPYMEYKEKLKRKGDHFTGSVNLGMGGTWQYQLKFKDAQEVVHKVRGSVNL